MGNRTTDRALAQQKHNDDPIDLDGLVHLGPADAREPEDTGWWASANPAEGGHGPTITFEGRFVGDGEHREEREVSLFSFTLAAGSVAALLWATSTPEGRSRLERLVEATEQL